MDRQSRAVLGLGGLLGAAAFGLALLERRNRRPPVFRNPRPEPNPFRTVHSDGKRRVWVDDNGRVDDRQQLPHWLQGVHYQDIPTVNRLLRQYDRADRAEARRRPPRATIRNVEEMASEILAANPELQDVVESESSWIDTHYLAWLRNRRRGPKPRPLHPSGEHDGINRVLERKTPGRKVGCWAEALRSIMPRQRRWNSAELGPRLAALEEDAAHVRPGIRVALPAPAEALRLWEIEHGRAHTGAETARDDLLTRARRERLTEPPRRRKRADAPF